MLAVQTADRPREDFTEMTVRHFLDKLATGHAVLPP